MIAGNTMIERPPLEVAQHEELERIDRLRTDLIDCTAIDEVLLIRGDLELLRTLMRQRRLSERAINVASYYISRAERTIGGMLKELGLRGGDKRAKSLDATLLLEDLELTKDDSYRFQLIHDIPETTYEDYMEVCITAGKRITRAGVLRLLEKPKSPDALGVEDCLYQFTDVVRDWVDRWPEDYRRVMGHHLVNLGNEILDTEGIRPSWR